MNRSLFSKFCVKPFNILTFVETIFVRKGKIARLILTLEAPILQNGQTHSNNSSANCHFVILALKVLITHETNK